MFVRGINGNLNRNVLLFFLSSNFSRKNGFHSLVAVADPGEGAQGGGGEGHGHFLIFRPNQSFRP